MASVHDSDASTIVELEVQRLLKLQKQSSSSVAVASESQQFEHITQYCYHMQSAHTRSTSVGEDGRRFTFKSEISLLASFEPSFVHASRDEYPPLTALHAATYAREMANATAAADSSSASSSTSGRSKVYDSATDTALTAHKTGDDDRTSDKVTRPWSHGGNVAQVMAATALGQLDYSVT
eukprot:1722-Heterococcus_DN1.PRE.1